MKFMKKFFLLFGGFWTAFTAFMTASFYMGNDDIIVNGELMAHEDFVNLVFPKIFFGLFWVIGLTVLGIGIFLTIKDFITKKKGEDCFAKVIDHGYTGVRVNGIPELKALLLVYIPSLNTTKEIYGVIGINPSEYPIGSIVKVKYYNNSAVIIGKADKSELSIVEENELKIEENYEQKEFNTGVNPDAINTSADVIEINGVKYKKIDE